jgi:glycosyltransferase involved in cell wall biosynthesis
VRVAVDARELEGRPTGVGRYLAELLTSWSHDPDARDVRITLLGTCEASLPPELGNAGAHIEHRIVGGGAGTRWEQVSLPRALRGAFDVLFSPAYSAPLLAPIPFVVAIHDVSFFAHPEWYAPREGLRRRWTVKASARRAARVLTISAFSQGEIVRHLGVPPDRVEVTWLAPWRRPSHAVVVRHERDATRPLILYAGSLLNRRQIPLLVRAFAPIARATPGARLVLVGENRTFPREDPAALAATLGIADAVDVRSWVSDAELSQLYRDALAFVWLSTYEGFGLPPVEAMAAGAPVIACDTAVAREVYGDAARLVREGDEAGLTAALELVLHDRSERTRLRSAAAGVLAQFSWDATARTTLDVLRRAWGHGGMRA